MKLEFASVTVKQLKAAPCLCCWQPELRPQEKEEVTSSQRSLGFQGAVLAGSKACARAAGSQRAAARSSRRGSTPARARSLSCEGDGHHPSSRARHSHASVLIG